MDFKSNWCKGAVVMALGLMAATQASGHSFIAMARSGNFTFGSAAGQVAVPVAAAAGNASTWLNLDVRAVNIATGQVFVLAPTGGTLDAFCTSNGTAASDGWNMTAVNAIGGAGMPAGNYRVQVRARLSGAGTGHLGDSSLVVWR